MLVVFIQNNLNPTPAPAPPGPDPVLPPSEEVEAVGYIADWGARLLTRLYEQFKDKPHLIALAHDVCGPQFQELEDTAQELLSLPNIDESVGAQLDNIGNLIGQLRSGVDDDTYRLYLKARVRANLSSGTPENIYTVMRAMFGPSVSMQIDQTYPAYFLLILSTPITSTEAAVALSFVGDSKLAGVRCVFEWQEFPDAQMFTFANATFLTVAATPLDTTLTVLDTSLLPIIGSVTLDPGLANAETRTYSVTGPTSMSLGSGLTNAHAINAAVELVGDEGLGFGDSSNPATGGAFEGAAYAA